MARPFDGLKINAGLGLLDTKIQDGEISGVVLDGNRLPAAPTVNFNAGFDWDVMKNDSGIVTLGVGGNYSSKQYFELINIDRLVQKNYIIINMQFGYRTANDRYGVALWGRNIFNEYYYRGAIDLSGLGLDYFHIGEPRTYGLTIDVKF